MILVSAGEESNQQMKVSDYSYHSNTCANASGVLHPVLSSSVQEVLYRLGVSSTEGHQEV